MNSEQIKIFLKSFNRRQSDRDLLYRGATSLYLESWTKFDLIGDFDREDWNRRGSRTKNPTTKSNIVRTSES